jgi:hypothetical protein
MLKEYVSDAGPAKRKLNASVIADKRCIYE